MDQDTEHKTTREEASMELGPATIAVEVPAEQATEQHNSRMEVTDTIGESTGETDVLAEAASRLDLRDRRPKRGSAWHKARRERRKEAKIAAGTWTKDPPPRNPRAESTVGAETKGTSVAKVMADQDKAKGNEGKSSTSRSVGAMANATLVTKVKADRSTKQGWVSLAVQKRVRSEESTPSPSSKQDRKKSRWDEGPSTSGAAGTGGSYAARLTAIKTAVTFDNYPDKKLDEAQWKDLVYQLTVRLKPMDNGAMPWFNDQNRLEAGALVLYCADKETRAWVERTVSEIGSFSNGTLQVGDANKVLNRVRAITRLPWPWCQMRVEEVLKVIEDTNNRPNTNPKLRINTKEWRVLNTQLEKEVMTVVMSLSEVEAEILRKSNFRLSLGMGIITFKLAEKTRRPE